MLFDVWNYCTYIFVSVDKDHVILVVSKKSRVLTFIQTSTPKWPLLDVWNFVIKFEMSKEHQIDY